MRSKLRAFLALSVVSAALTACSDQPTSAPIVPRVTAINAAITNLPATGCNFTTLRAAVRAYVASGNDVIYNYIRDMSTEPYDQGMNGLARLAEVRATTGLKKSGATAAEGAAAVIQFLQCMPIGGAVQDGFTTNIVAAMDTGGMFEVPLTTSTDAIFSRGEAQGATYWAARPKPLPDGQDADELPDLVPWGDLTNETRFMVFGYQTGTTEKAFDYNVVPMLGAELGAVDMPTSFRAPGLVIGACDSDTFADSIRVQHEADILFDENMSFCPGATSPPLGSLSSGVSASFASLVRRSLGVFTPQPLYAAVFGGGVGGAVSELSPADLEPVSPTIQYFPGPANNKSIGQALNIQVRLFTGLDWDKGDPLNNADVTLTVTGNSGLNAVFYDPDTQKTCHFVTRKTINGVANFSNVSVIKAGGYTLTAEAVFDKLDANALVSNLFNVKNNKQFTVPTAKC